MKTLQQVSKFWTRNRFALTVTCLGLATFGLVANVKTASAAQIAFYPLNHSLADTSGNGNTGTAASGLTYAPGGGIVSDGVSTNQYFTAPIDMNSLAQVTFGALVEVAPTAANPIREIITADQGGFGRTIDIDNRGSGNGYSAFSGNGVFGGSILPSGAPTLDFVAVTYNSTTNTDVLDVNGHFTTSTGTPSQPATSFLTIGRSLSFDNPFGGIIKDVFVYNTALTPSQLNSLQLQLIPEPSSFVLGGLGIVGLLLAALRRRKA